MEEDLSTVEEERAVYEKLAKRTVDNLNRKGFIARFVATREEALALLMELIPEGALVGTADSTTLLQIGIFSALRKRGRNELLNPFQRDKEGHLLVEGAERHELMRRILLSDVYIIGTNAVSMDGKLVNIDGYGNRVAPMLFGPNKVIIVVGGNKIVRDVDEAIKRIKTYSAPQNAIRHVNKHHRPQFADLPCAKNGFCADCMHPWRICAYTTIIESVRQPERGRLNVVIVGEKLGL